MAICDKSYPRKLAFSYLDELSKEFQGSYGDKIEAATRPYAFMGFGKFTNLSPVFVGPADHHQTRSSPKRPDFTATRATCRRRHPTSTRSTRTCST
jgi:hypothetical protein